MEISTRGAFRAQLTKLAKAANEALQSESFKISDNCEFEKIEDDLCILIDRLNAVHASLRSADQRIISQQLIKPEDVEMEGQKIADYEDTAVTTLAQLNQRLRKVQSKPRPMMNTEQQRNIISPQKGNTKLPKLQLKRFNGEMKEWLPFWDQYNIAVHQNEQLTDADKFHYLEGALVGAARRVVEGFTATSSCYEAAVALLREQYGDTEILVDNHMQKLIALRPVSARTDVVGLRHLYNTITTSIRYLTALQVPTQQYDVMLKTVLLRCMPVELRVDYHPMSEKENDIAELSDLEIQSFLSQKRIQWSFIVERAPWWGGFWERLIRTVKNTLKVTIGKAKLTFEQLRTVLTEAEAIANDRPLTYVSSDPLDLAPLTPAKFLLGFSSSVSSFQADVSGETSLKDLWKHRMKFTARLSKRWQIEYLQVLRSFHHAYGKTSNQLNEGDIVLLFDQATPRIHWKMVIINKVFIGRDGKVRSCEIRRADGQVLRRPVQLLYPLELSSIGPPEDVEN